MRGVFFPNSNLLFTVQTRDPAAPVPPPDPAAKGAGFSVFEWGQGIYTGWPVIENAAAALADASPWMLTPGLRCENGRLAPVTEPDWIRFTEQMVSVGQAGLPPGRRPETRTRSRNGRAISPTHARRATPSIAMSAVVDEGPTRSRAA